MSTVAERRASSALPEVLSNVAHAVTRTGCFPRRPPERAPVRRRRSALRDAWSDEVCRTDALDNSARAVLLWLCCRHMDAAGFIEVPRRVIADQFGIAEQRVTVRMGQALKAGLLVRAAGGINGRTVRYQAVLPRVEGAGKRHPQVEVEGVVFADPVRVSENDTLDGRSGCRKTTPYEEEPRAPARAPSVVNATTPTTARDMPPAADTRRGTTPRPLAAAAPRPEGERQDESGDYFAGRSRQPTEVGQGNHRPRARINGAARADGIPR